MTSYFCGKKTADFSHIKLFLPSMSHASVSMSIVPALAADAELIPLKIPCVRTNARPMYDEISTKQMIRTLDQSTRASNDGRMIFQDLGVDELCDAYSSVPTSNMFTQDDCLNSESAPRRPTLQGSSGILRARYNFQQGLINMKEVMDVQRQTGNASITSFAAPLHGRRGTANACSKLSNQD